MSGVIPEMCIPGGTVYWDVISVGQYRLYSTCGASYVVQHTRCNQCGAICVVQVYVCIRNRQPAHEARMGGNTRTDLFQELNEGVCRNSCDENRITVSSTGCNESRTVDYVRALYNNMSDDQKQVSREMA
eukprot:9102848-Pyramimonas_sp.AAC.1